MNRYDLERHYLQSILSSKILRVSYQKSMLNLTIH